MSDNAEAPPKARTKRPKKRQKVGVRVVFSLALAGLIFTYTVMILSGRVLPVPEFLHAKVETRINERLEGTPLSIGGMGLAVARNGAPQILVSNVRLGERASAAAAELNAIGATLVPGRLIRGDIMASELVLQGAQVTVRRNSDGSFAFQTSNQQRSESIADLLGRLDTVLSSQTFSTLEKVEARGVVISLEDARIGRIWQATNAISVLRRNDTGLTLSITSDVFNGTDQVAGIQLSLSLNRATRAVSMGVQVTDMPAADIALQSPVLSWLGVLDAPISGAVRSEFDADGVVTSFAGTLDIQGGALSPAEDVEPVTFQSAKAYFTYDQDRQRIDFSEISFASKQGTLLASGHSYLSELDGPWPRAFLGQYQISDLSYDGGDVLDGPVQLSDMQADLRLRLDPFTVELAQVNIDNLGEPVHASGVIEAREDGWHASIDATTNLITSERVLEYWPKPVSPITRGWLSENLNAGVLKNTSAALRLVPGEKPSIGLSFDFQRGKVRLLKHMPRLEEATGRAELSNRRFALTVSEGNVTAATGGVVDFAGSTFVIKDIRPKPATGHVELITDGPLVASLSILNNPPLRLMERAKRPVDLAEASAQVRAQISLPLKDGIKQEEVTYEVAARLSDVVSTTLVEGRKLTANALALTGNPERLGITGSAKLDGVPLSVAWSQPLGEAAAQGGEITGTVALSQATAEAFGVPVPSGFLRGRGQGSYRLSLPVEGAPRLALQSNLAGLTMSVPGIGWTKPANERGNLSVAAILGDVPQIEGVELETNGLTLDGDIALDDEGRFTGATFANAKIGGWLDGQVRVAPGGIAITGGTFDLRRFEAPSGGSGGGGGNNISLNLDRVIVSDSIALAPMIGSLDQGRAGMSGQFEARINGRTPVRGTLVPANGGTAIRVQSNDAAGVLRDAGLTPNTQQGTLDLVLTPIANAPGGSYDGQFLIEDIRLRNAPFMADLLDAISIVGLIDQFNGPGISFSSVDGEFRLTRRQIVLKKLAAVGGSLGISADGIYDIARSQMDIQGVVSPVYFLNGIGSFLTRRGEGLFGFNYSMRGPANDPTVGVNPLSIFTPGAFREIFRRSPPRG